MVGNRPVIWLSREKTCCGAFYRRKLRTRTRTTRTISFGSVAAAWISVKSRMLTGSCVVTMTTATARRLQLLSPTASSSVSSPPPSPWWSRTTPETIVYAAHSLSLCLSVSLHVLLLFQAVSAFLLTWSLAFSLIRLQCFDDVLLHVLYIGYQTYTAGARRRSLRLKLHLLRFVVELL